MSKKTHQRELERARAKRQADAYARRQQRMRFVAIGLVVALAGGVFVAAALSGSDEPEVAIDGFDSSQDTSSDDAPGDDAADDAAGDTTALESVDNPCPAPPADAPVPPQTTYDAPPEMVIDPEATYTATMRTTCGDIQIELFAADAPITVNNFVFLANDGFYEGVPFHRIIDGFMIQGGDPTGTGGGGPGYRFEDELDTVAKYGMGRGTLAMANAGPDTNGSQFFIVQGVADHLTSHTVFGRVVEGMDVVDDIVAGPKGGPRGDSAVEPVLILGIDITEA